MEPTNISQTVKNLVLDMGNVMIVYDPALFIRRAGIMDVEDSKMLLERVFRSSEWPMMDSGELTEDTMAALVLPRLPERLRQVADDLIHRWWDPIVPMPGMEELVKRCKAAGYHVYLLSNASVLQPMYWQMVPGHELFEGTVISALIKTMKPDKGIYLHLCEKYSLKPEECLFVDDVQATVEGAVAAGMEGFLFPKDTAALEKYIFG